MEGADRGCHRASQAQRRPRRDRPGRAAGCKRAGHERIFPGSRWLASRIHVVSGCSSMTAAPTPLHDPNVLPAGLPVPQDDGAARHLTGLRLPAAALAATDGSKVDLVALAGRTVVYIYPRTGRPGVPLPDGWDAIPGARGCTPQSCSFRDHFAELKGLGVTHVFGLSTQ